jgi:hypothetical protein
MLGRFLKRSLDKEPIVVLATFLGVTSTLAVVVVPPIRHSLGWPTEQVYGVEAATKDLPASSWSKSAPGASPVRTA